MKFVNLVGIRFVVLLFVAEEFALRVGDRIAGEDTAREKKGRLKKNRATTPALDKKRKEKKTYSLVGTGSSWK